MQVADTVGGGCTAGMTGDKTDAAESDLPAPAGELPGNSVTNITYMLRTPRQFLLQSVELP